MPSGRLQRDYGIQKDINDSGDMQNNMAQGYMFWVVLSRKLIYYDDAKFSFIFFAENMLGDILGFLPFVVVVCWYLI